MPINSNASTKKKSFYKKKGRQTGGKSREFAVKNDVKSLSELPQSTSGQLCQLPVAFTHDARMFFGSTDQEVRFFSVATGQMTRVLSKRIEDYHTAPLSAAILNHASPDQLLTSALDGQIKVWNYEDQTLLKTLIFNDPVHHINISKGRPNELLALTFNTDTGISSVYWQKLADATKQSPKLITQIPNYCQMAWSTDGNVIALVSERQFHIGLMNKEGSVEWRMMNLKSRATCLALHPTEACLAIGDVAGRIHLWYYQSPSENEQIPSTTLHWHSYAVQSINFTSDGIHMLSGGTEGVMVIWHLRSGTKQFLPHLGADIASIAVSPDQSYYAIAQKNNVIRVVNALDLTIKQMVQGLKIGASDEQRLLSGSMAVEPRTGHLVLNGTAGSLQFYNPLTQRHILDLEVMPISHLARAPQRQQHLQPQSQKVMRRKNIHEPVVDHVAFTKDGKWMITADSRHGSRASSEQFLKFWFFDTKKQSYQLRTRVDTPHQGRITSISTTVRDGVPLVVTTSKDGRWKAWGTQTDDRTKYWTCLSSCDYRGMIARWSAFSDDGSVLAVAFNDVNDYFMDPWYATVKCVLAYSVNKRPIHQLGFVADTPYLVATSEHYIYVWNLLTCSVHWSIQMKVEQLAFDSTLPQFTVIGSIENQEKKYLLTFDPAHPTPKSVQPTRAQAVIYASIGSGSTNAITSLPSSLVILNDDNEMHVYSSSKKTDLTSLAISDQQEQDNMDESEPTGLFTSLFGKTKEQSSSTATAMENDYLATIQSKTSTEADDLWTLPAHVMPSVHSVYTHFMSNLLTSTNHSNDDNPDSNTMDNSLSTIDTATVKTALSSESSVMTPITTFVVINETPDVPLLQSKDDTATEQDKPVLTMLTSLFHKQLSV